MLVQLMMVMQLVLIKLKHLMQIQDEQREFGTDSLEYRNAFMNYVLKGENIPNELRASAVTKQVMLALLFHKLC